MTGKTPRRARRATIQLSGAPETHRALVARIPISQQGNENACARVAPTILSQKAPPKPSAVFDTYWKFASERQAVYHRRISGQQAPWTSDPILSSFKFTNAYRAADRVSQFLIRHVIYAGQFDVIDTVFRTLLFKLFNKTQTWHLLERMVGPIDTKRFDVDLYDRVLAAAMQGGASIYSAAYIMPSGPLSIRRTRKHRMHLELLATLMRDGTIARLANTNSMTDAYQILVELPGLGPFLAYQLATDLNYSAHHSFSEMEFVMPGPGAKDGLRKCFLSLGDYSEADTIRWVTDRQETEFQNRGVKFQSLWGRPLQLIDCQNLFCEVDKYARVAHPEIAGLSGRTRIKQRFAAHPSLPQPWFPPKWGINQQLGQTSREPIAEPWSFTAVGENLQLGIED